MRNKRLSDTITSRFADNNELTADSLGPRVCEKIVVTRHVKEVIKKEVDSRLKTVSVLTTGVLGTTGIETAKMIKLISSEVKPDLVIVVDTLATSKASRLATSFQLTNASIVPGGGVNNNRQIINKDLLGVPLIVVGVPFVIYASSMFEEILFEAENSLINTGGIGAGTLFDASGVG